MTPTFESFNQEFYFNDNFNNEVYHFIPSKNEVIPERLGTLLPMDNFKNCCGVFKAATGIYFKTHVAGVPLKSSIVLLSEFTIVEKP